MRCCHLFHFELPRALGVLLSLLLYGGPAGAQDVVDVVADSRFYLEQEGQPLCLPYYASRPLDTPDAAVRRVVIMVHGTLRNADDYYQTIVGAAMMAQDETCLLIAPQFLIGDDLSAHGLSDEHLYWGYYGWRQGDLSRDSTYAPRPWRISSYAVVDSIMLRVAEVFPNLERIVVAGHSAGGQFANRLAAGSEAEQILNATHGISLRYIVSNPSSYLYFSPERWTGGYDYQFAVPSAGEISQCPDYDDYKFGLQARNTYMGRLDEDTLRTMYTSRQVVYLLGQYDNQWDFYLDTSCPANFQGEHRRERGTVYYAYLQHCFGYEIIERQRFAIIPNVGHDHEGVFKSACGLRYLLDHGTCEDVAAAIVVSPAEGFVFTLDQDENAASTLTISNTGEVGSLLHYSLRALDANPPRAADPPRGVDVFRGAEAGAGTPASGQGDRNISGSYLEADLTEYEIGWEGEVELTLHCVGDEEIVRVELDFPPGVVLESAEDFGIHWNRLVFRGALGDGAHAVWTTDTGYGVMPGQSLNATLDLRFTQAYGEITAPYEITGAGYGQGPHQITDALIFNISGPYVVLISPNGGEAWGVGDEVQMLYAAGNGPENIRLELRRGETEPWELLGENLPPGLGSLNWTVTESMSASCRVRVSDMVDTDLSDMSEADFMICHSLAWLDIDRDDGCLNWGESVEIGVAVDALGLAAGIYEAELLLEHDCGEALTLPLMLTVEEAVMGIVETPAPGGLRLAQAYPNPFNPQTRVELNLPTLMGIRLSIHDVGGRLVKLLADGRREAGFHTYIWDGRDQQGREAASGVYFCCLEAGSLSRSIRMMLVR